MARQNIYADPSVKSFEAFMDFSGGMNSETTNEKLNENEYPVMLNVDLSGKSPRLRPGRAVIANIIGGGNAQGMFFYYRESVGYPDIIAAANGKLYVLVPEMGQVAQIDITDNGAPFTFQTTRQIEAVQYKDDMFIATGTKLVEMKFDTATSWYVAKTVTPYTPSVMEAIYIGTNALAANPDAYIQDGVSQSANVEAVGVKPQYRTAAVNKPMMMTAYINKPSGYAGTVDYKWEYKKSADTAWVTERDFTAGANTNTYTFETAGNYDVRLTVRKTGDATPTTPLQQFVMTSYEVKPVEDRNAVMPVDAIQKCTRILLHWDRVLLYGDDKYPYQMYISDLNNPRYVPVTNSINFDIGRQEGINAAVRFQNMLVVFTKTTIQTLVGKSTEDYQRFQIHDGIGCTAGWSAKVVGNRIFFLSHEGVHSLTPNPYRLETMNVARIDGKIKSEMFTDTDACAVVSNSQYWLCFPQKKTMYRLYYETGAWVKDASENLDLCQFLTYGDEVYNLSKTGIFYKHDPNLFTDGTGIYFMEVESKHHDLSASFNYKKLRKLYVLAKHYPVQNVDMFITVLADSAIVLTPTSGEAKLNPDTGKIEWISTTKPNMQFNTGTSFGTWIVGKSPLGDVLLSVQEASVRGKCRRVKVSFKSGGGKECELFGFGLEFMLKNP